MTFDFRLVGSIALQTWLKLALLAWLVLSHSASGLEIQVDTSFKQRDISQPLPTLQQTPGIQFNLDTPIPADRFSQQLYRQSLQPGDSVYWYRLNISSVSAEGRQVKNTHLGAGSQKNRDNYYLMVGNSIITHLDVFIYRKGQLIEQQQLGAADRKTQSKQRYRGSVVELQLAPGEELTLLFRKQSNSPAIMPLQLFSESSFENKLFNQYLFWGAAIALLAAIALYNVAIYLLVRLKSYIWYLTFYSITFFYFAGLHGFGHLMWSDDIQRWLSQHIMTLNFLLLWVLLHFAAEFLKIKQNAPWHAKYIRWFDYVLPLGFIASFFIVEYQLIPVFGLLQFAGSLFAITMAITAYRNEFRPARFFILSWTFVIVGAAVGMLTFTNLIEANFFTVHGFFFGTLIELILLSIALADRLQHSEKLAISQAFTDPQTRQPNYSFFTSSFFTEQPVFKQNRPMAMMLLKLKGFRQLLGLLGPSGIEQAYQLHISRVEDFLAHSEWALEFELPNSGKSHMVSLPGDHILIVAEVKDDYESIVIPLLHLAEKAIRIGKLESKLTFRIGVARFDVDELDVHECYRHAQLALLNSYSSQKEWFVYRPEDDAAFRSRLALLADLRQALESEELKIYIQPQFTTSDRALCGGEVLVRWTHPTKGMVSPTEFISLAEESNLIFKITKAVIHESFEWLSYINIDVNQFKLSINLSGLDIQHGELIPYVRWQLERSKVDPRQVTFEVTESAISDDRVAFLKVLNELKSLGFTIAIDDFGTGYSSMQYMQQMNADIIKVDMSFIRNIHQSDVNQKIVDAIIRVANATGAYIVAEGVEIEEELAVLKNLGAQNIQGYLFGEPVPAVVFERRYLNTIGLNR